MGSFYKIIVRKVTLSLCFRLPGLNASGFFTDFGGGQER